MDKWNQRLISAVAAMLLLLSVVYVGKEAVLYTSGRSVNVQSDVMCVVIDAGHGGGYLR